MTRSQKGTKRAKKVKGPRDRGTPNGGAKAIRSVKDLTLDRGNVNRGTDRGRAMVGASIDAYGYGRSVLVDADGVLIAGEKTTLAAKQRGAKVKVVQVRGDELVVVQRLDARLKDDPEFKARGLSIADNRTAEVGLDFDVALLEAEIDKGLDLGEFYTDAELAALAAGDDGTAEASGEGETEQVSFTKKKTRVECPGCGKRFDPKKHKVKS